ncbi:MAG: MlaD family protein [Bacteroidota bacterium]|nr:MlaD family protein [Bacteroidota bacterium]
MFKPLSSEVKIGLIVVSAIAIFFWGMNFLKGKNLLKPSNYYYVNYTNVNGLVKSSPVILDGYQVGLVSDIEYQFDHPGNILVTLDLNRKLQLHRGTIATIKSAMVGNPTVVLTLGAQERPLLSGGDSLIAMVEPGLMDQLNHGLLQNVQVLVKRTDSLIAGVQTIVSDGSLKSSLKSIEKTSRELEQISTKINHSVDNDLPSILRNINTLTGELATTGYQLNQLDLKGTVGRLDKTIDEFGALTVRLNSPDNSMGLLLNDKSLYLNLSNTASSANSLLLDLKDHPKRYVHFSLFGSSNK